MLFNIHLPCIESLHFQAIYLFLNEHTYKRDNVTWNLRALEFIFSPIPILEEISFTLSCDHIFYNFFIFKFHISVLRVRRWWWWRFSSSSFLLSFFFNITCLTRFCIFISLIIHTSTYEIRYFNSITLVFIQKADFWLVICCLSVFKEIAFQMDLKNYVFFFFHLPIHRTRTWHCFALSLFISFFFVSIKLPASQH
jgi:hypothetical protein